MTRPRSQSKLGPPGFAVHTRRSSNSRKERPAAPGPGGQGAALGYPRPPRATWWGGRSPRPGGWRERLPPRQISGNARQAGIPQPAPGAASTHPLSGGSGRRPPRRAPRRPGRSSGNPLPAFGR